MKFKFSQTIILLCTTFILLSCKRELAFEVKSELQSQTPINAVITPMNTTVNAHAICNYVFTDSSLTNHGWTKTFEDNFDTDLSQWNIWTGGAYNNELQFYQAANLQVTGGNLVITAKKQTVTGPSTPGSSTNKTFNYTSGRIECKTNIGAGTTTPKVRIVASIKLPTGYGMWPAYWSYGDPWPTQGEIDYLEARGQDTTKYQTNYFYGTTVNNNLVTNQVGFINTDGSLTSCHHVYVMEWSQNALTSYLDGVLVEAKTGGYVPNLFGKTERIALNLAVGGDFFTGLIKAKIVTGTMYVDYVKVFTSN